MLHWTKAAQCVWTAPLTQSLFLIQRRRKGASWLNTDWMSVYDGGFFFFFFLVLFRFSLNSVSHYCAQPQAVRGKNQTRATVPKPRGPQEPRGVHTLMEAWASLEHIAWWGQKHTATTAPLLQTPSSALTDIQLFVWLVMYWIRRNITKIFVNLLKAQIKKTSATIETPPKQ